MVAGHPATYVRGSWNQQLQWDDTASFSTRAWEADGFTCVLQYSGPGNSRADLIRIAESLR
jgi:hypothetical protein